MVPGTSDAQPGRLCVMTEQNETKAISQLVKRLVLRFPHIPAETVEETVSAAHHEFEQATVRDFVPLLVEHDVLIRLEKLAGHADVGMANPETESRAVALDPRP